MPALCAWVAHTLGADLKQRATFTEAEVAEYVTRFRRLTLTLSELPVPVIAALDGLAFGGGLEIALCCDIRIAGEVNLMLRWSEESWICLSYV